MQVGERKLSNEKVEFMIPLSSRNLKALRKGNDYAAYYQDTFEEGDKQVIIVGKKTKKKDYYSMRNSGYEVIFIKVNNEKLRAIKNKRDGIEFDRGRFLITVFKK